MSETNTPVINIECTGMLVRSQLHELEDDSTHEPVALNVTFEPKSVLIDIQGGERIWIERVNGVTIVRLYDQSHDEPVSITLGKDAIGIDSEDYDGRMSA